MIYRSKALRLYPNQKMLGCLQLIASFAAFLFLVFHFHRRRYWRDLLFPDWPLIGMLPSFLKNLGQTYDYTTEVLQRKGGTGNFLGPWFTGMNYLVTCDPMNVHRIMSKNFANYIKGHDLREVLDAFGDSIFTVDSDAWKHYRALQHSVFKAKCFEKFREKIVREKVESCLIPLLDQVEKRGVELDLQDVFGRFNFDAVCSIVLGFDPKSLALDFQEVACIRAFDEVGECTFYRQTIPKSVWKLQRWLGIGPEKKMARACEVFDRFLYESIASKREKLPKINGNEKEADDLLACLMRGDEGKDEADDMLLRDTAFSLLFAGRDTITSALTWFFWLVATHPSVEAKIHEEIKEEKEVKDQVYLHAALCEGVKKYGEKIAWNSNQKDGSQGEEVLFTCHHTNLVLSLQALGHAWVKTCLSLK
ncbi:alkane hydroxylase MAH1-like isoform X2 [Prosopis cineraria]|uniref:alkane hydroxylase MAH1-like isoform X2 n=1 Tax=Prosopis cineraria TaxID=364024 RepID=UPI0024104AFD|nr:alkane hydroxylase MAH1-like isoform X2 [Prosopis cineraria]